MIQLVALNFQLLPEQIQVEAHLAVRTPLGYRPPDKCHQRREQKQGQRIPPPVHMATNHVPWCCNTELSF